MSTTALTDSQKYHVKECVKKAKAQWGAGWAHLSEDMRQAYIARECLGLFLIQDESCQTPSVFAKLVAVAQAALNED